MLSIGSGRNTDLRVMLARAGGGKRYDGIDVVSVASIRLGLKVSRGRFQLVVAASLKWARTLSGTGSSVVRA
jgi:hypothetical protein